jgi:hypothetical protein
MGNYVHHRVKMLLEETSDAFSSCGSVNSDYAEFATMALSEFKHALRKPSLTSKQLRMMLRNGTMKHRALKPESSWAAFLADHIENSANGDAH